MLRAAFVERSASVPDTECGGCNGEEQARGREAGDEEAAEPRGKACGWLRSPVSPGCSEVADLP